MNRTIRRPLLRPSKGKKLNGRKTRPNLVDPAHSTKRDAIKEVGQIISGTALRLLKAPISDNLLINFRWNAQITSMANSNPYVGLQWNINSLATVDGTNVAQMAYLSEWATFYQFYRVIETHYKLTMINANTFPVNLVCLPLAYENGVGNNYADTSYLFGEPYSQQAMVSATTGLDRHVFTGKINQSELIGSMEYYKDDNYSAQFGASPARKNFFYIGAWGPSSTTAVNFELEFQFTTHCYNHTQLNGLVNRIARKKALTFPTPIVSPQKVIMETSLAPVNPVLDSILSTTTTGTTTSSSISDCDCDESFLDYTEY